MHDVTAVPGSPLMLHLNKPLQSLLSEILVALLHDKRFYSSTVAGVAHVNGQSFVVGGN